MYTIVSVTRSYLREKVDQFITILKDQKIDYWKREHFLLEKKGKWQYSFALEEDGNVLGYIIVSLNDQLQSLHIHKFMVAPDKRGLGYGTMLFQHLLQIITTAPYKDISLKVYRENGGALKFYKRLGFEVIDDSGDYFLMIRQDEQRKGRKT